MNDVRMLSEPIVSAAVPYVAEREGERHGHEHDGREPPEVERDVAEHQEERGDRRDLEVVPERLLQVDALLVATRAPTRGRRRAPRSSEPSEPSTSPTTCFTKPKSDASFVGFTSKTSFVPVASR